MTGNTDHEWRRDKGANFHSRTDEAFERFQNQCHATSRFDGCDETGGTVVFLRKVAVISELQQTWNRPDAMEFANLYADYAMPNYRLLMESYAKAQDVAVKGHETKMDAVKG